MLSLIYRSKHLCYAYPRCANAITFMPMSTVWPCWSEMKDGGMCGKTANQLGSRVSPHDREKSYCYHLRAVWRAVSPVSWGSK